MPLAVFDVNETMLDLGMLDGFFIRHFGDLESKDLWFSRLLHHKAVVTLTGHHQSMGPLAAAALVSVAQTRGVTLPDDAGRQLTLHFERLRPYPDVRPGLTALKEAGWTLMTLTNSSPMVAEAGLRNAGIIDCFHAIHTVEESGRFKPAPEPYYGVLSAAAESIEESWMVACHDWDLAGATNVGMKTAFIKREGMPLSPAYPTPTLIVDDFEKLAEALLAGRSHLLRA